MKPIRNSQFAIRNSQFAIKSIHPQGVGFLPALGYKNCFAPLVGEVLNLYFFDKLQLATYCQDTQERTLGKVILVTGPARSGKSEWAETLAMQTGKAVVYVATATDNLDDQEWHQRIVEHQQRRPQDWVTISVPVELSATLANAKPYTCLLVDSLGTWVANLLEEDKSSWENILAEFLETVDLVAADMVFVAEEVGWGVIPAYPLGRTFRDRLGSLVRQLAGLSQTVYLVTGGHVLNLGILGSPLPIRGEGEVRSQDS